MPGALSDYPQLFPILIKEIGVSPCNGDAWGRVGERLRRPTPPPGLELPGVLSSPE